MTRDEGQDRMDSLAFLERNDPAQPQPVYALTGDEGFLKRQVVQALRRWLLGEDDGFGYSSQAGDKAVWSAVHDELQTLPFLGGRRLVVIDGADPFVTKNRAARLLVELIGPEMGLLDQELAKLAAYAGEAKKIDAGDVDRLVGNSRSEEVWKIFEAIGAGQAGTALTMLDRLLEQKHAPEAIL